VRERKEKGKKKKKERKKLRKEEGKERKSRLKKWAPVERDSFAVTCSGHLYSRA
jgi:hypothetical protein